MGFVMGSALKIADEERADEDEQAYNLPIMGLCFMSHVRYHLNEMPRQGRNRACQDGSPQNHVALRRVVAVCR